MKTIAVLSLLALMLISVKTARSEAVLQLTNYGKAGVALKQTLDSNLARQEVAIKQMWFKQLQTGKLDYWFMMTLDGAINHYNDGRYSAAERLKFYGLGSAVIDDTVAAVIKADHFYFSDLAIGDDSTKFIAVSMIGKNIEVSDSSNLVAIVIILLAVIAVCGAGYATSSDHGFEAVGLGVVAVLGVVLWVHLSLPYESFGLSTAFLIAVFILASGLGYRMGQ